MAYFKKKSCTLIIENSGWGEQYGVHEKELEIIMKGIIKNGKEKEIDKMLELSLVRIIGLISVENGKGQFREYY